MNGLERLLDFRDRRALERHHVPLPLHLAVEDLRIFIERH
jgi:hypothetical protein